MLKTEITVQCFDGLERIAELLLERGFAFKESFRIDDRYYSPRTNDQLKDMDFLGKINNSFLVREIIASGKELRALIYKAKQCDSLGNVVAEEKTQVAITDLRAALDIFDKAGLNNWCRVLNTSYVYRAPLFGGIELAIQVIDELGIFIEFEEYAAIKELSPHDKFKSMRETLLGFGLKLGDDFSVKKAEMLFTGDAKR